MTKEFMMIFSMNLPFFLTQLTRFGKNDTLVDVQIHGKYNEQRISLVHLCIQKLWWIM